MEAIRNPNPVIFLLMITFISPLALASNRLSSKMNGEWERSVFSLGVGLSTLLASKLGLKVPQSCAWCEPSTFELELSFNAIWAEPKEAALYSDAIAYGLIPGLSALVALYEFEDSSNVLLNVLTLMNTAILTYSVTEAFKRGTARERPESYFNLVVGDAYERFLSFPSGHSSTAFALATASSWLAFKRSYNWAPFVVFLSGLSAVGAGYFRIAAGKHWLSDVGAGAAIGIFVGSVVPLFTFANIAPMPGAQGLTLSWNW